MNEYNFEAKCVWSPNDLEKKYWWKEGGTYVCTTKNFRSFYIRCEKLVQNPIGGFLNLEEFRKMFKTDFKVTDLPPADFIDPMVLAELASHGKR